MKILITGATGLVGKHLGLELVRRGHSVVIVTRSRGESGGSCSFPCEIIEGDLSQGPIDNPLFNEVNGVVNLMGEPIAKGFWSEEKKKRLRGSRVESTHFLKESLKNAKLDVVVSASAIGIYGSRRDEELTENSEMGNDFLAQLCRDWEAAALTMAGPQTRIVLPRIGLVVSRKGGLLEELMPLFANGIGGPIGDGQHWMSWIHIDDLVSSLIYAIENPKVKGVFNAVAPTPVRNIEFSQSLARRLHRPCFVKVPSLALKLVMQEKADVLQSSQRVFPQALLKWGFSFKNKDLDCALACELKHAEKGEDLFEAEQFIAQPLSTLFPFFSDAKNLEEITPESLNFKILSVSTPEVQKGTLIEYKLNIHGVPVHWKTEIEVWNPPFEFVDNQLKGPYRLWHHTHRFESLAGGTLMTDSVRFQLPMGTLGRLFGGFLVRSEVAKIFSYRRKKISEIFKVLEK